MAEWFKKYSETINSSKDSVLVLNSNNQLSERTNAFKLVIADFASRQFGTADVLEVAKELQRIITQKGYLIIRLKSMRNPRYLDTKHVKSDRGLVIDRRGNVDRYFDEAQIDDFFSPYFNIENLSEELMDEGDRNSFVYTCCFRKNKEGLD